MTISSTGNSSLDKISSSYQSSDSEKTKKDDALGRDAFLTMLVAQLQNQDPLNPMDGTDFSAQLAQFSQLEQLINLNDSMDSLATSFSKKSEGDAVSYIGKQVTGNVNIMTVDEGTVSGGFYNLSKAADVMVSITDADGKTVKTLYPGQQATGSHLISWNGTDNNGDAVEDGSYTYTVLANTGSGFAAVPSSITGTVSGVAYNNGKAYLVVQGILLDLESVTAVSDIAASGGSESALNYLGKTVTSNSPIILMEDGDVSGDELNFKLDAQKDVTIKIYDVYDELVKTITVSAGNTVSGENKVEWNGMSDSGYKAEDGLYYYTVKADSSYAKTTVSEEVSGIKYVNGGQYLVMKDSGRLVSLSTITGIN
jgi:flagellar basal-body rod modification protein FlgD